MHTDHESPDSGGDNAAGEPAMQTAMEWVRRIHERELKPAECAALAAWRGSHPVHAKAYKDAQQLWMLAGLVPPITDLPARE